ncbi:unnamed protein product [Adineta steineri]|uniref:Uncharacterized protein n=1 Tax=Adineta steineri TaxID=433720 RepID=A0A815IBG4_9BILA|nr:unnamed protein product [Adineta steineri]CAF1404993.1 unnamed protein product [Adineta steineri]CAF3855182.1 unnamed protein product [Adineta steineri]CAF4027432.1 unnamed protein product [Adineta steineri]
MIQSGKHCLAFVWQNDKSLTTLRKELSKEEQTLSTSIILPMKTKYNLQTKSTKDKIKPSLHLIQLKSYLTKVLSFTKHINEIIVEINHKNISQFILFLFYTFLIDFEGEQWNNLTNDQILKNLIPLKYFQEKLSPSGQIFIGLGTHQTTGIGMHIYSHLIPTIKCENLGLQDPYISIWNEQLLKSIGNIIRFIYGQTIVNIANNHSQYLNTILSLYSFQTTVPNKTIEISYNQPKIPQYACWSPEAITFLNQSIIVTAYELFVSRNNTVYVAELHEGRVSIWHEDSILSIRNNFTSMFDPVSLFVTINGDIYVASHNFTTNGGIFNASHYRRTSVVQKWTSNATDSTVVMNTSHACFGIFVDIDNYLYCSMSLESQVVKQSLNGSMNTFIIVAGSDRHGSAHDMLYNPRGIFVTINFDLYVADCGNDRVQLFEFGQRNATTVAGRTSSVPIALECPTAVFLDADEHLFIVEVTNRRIIRSHSNGFSCVAGCSSEAGASSHQLSSPGDAAFDSYGNIFVADSDNDRVQKFILTKTGSGK